MSNAQMWCPAGATWHYDWVTISPMTGYVKIEYTNDTTILSISCKKLQKTLHGYNFSSQQFFSQNIGSEFTYEAGNVIYVFDTTDVDFDTLVNFNALIGNTWTMPQRSVMSFCENQSSVTVLDTGSRIINGQSLKWIYVNNVFDPNNINMSYTDTFYEKIGPTQWYFLPYPYCEESVDLDNGGKLRCYVDDFFPMYSQTSNACDYTVSIEVNENIKEELLKIFPNPTNNLLSIVYEYNSENNSTIEITDITGKVIKSYTLYRSTSQASLEELSEGIYIVRLIVNNSLVITKKVILVR